MISWVSGALTYCPAGHPTPAPGTGWPAAGDRSSPAARSSRRARGLPGRCDDALPPRRADRCPTRPPPLVIERRNHADERSDDRVAGRIGDGAMKVDVVHQELMWIVPVGEETR